MQNDNLVLNHFLTQYWLVVIFGLLHFAYLERHVLITWVRKTGKKAARASLASARWRLWYVLGGTVFTFMAWAIVSFLLTTFWSASVYATPAAQLVTGADLFTAARYYAAYAGLFGITGFIAAGTCITLSAGSRWLVVTGKVLTTLTILGVGLTLTLASFPSA